MAQCQQPKTAVPITDAINCIKILVKFGKKFTFEEKLPAREREREGSLDQKEKFLMMILGI